MTDEEQKRIFAANLSYYVNASGKMQKDIASDLKVPRQTFNGWCKGVSIPTMGKVQKIADYFNIGKSDLLDNKGDHVFHLTDEEKRIIESYREFTDDQKELVSRMFISVGKIQLD